MSRAACAASGGSPRSPRTRSTGSPANRLKRAASGLRSRTSSCGGTGLERVVDLGDRESETLLQAPRMNAFDVIEAATEADLVDEGGEPIAWKALPGLSSEAVAALERKLGFEPPGELLDLLPRCAGVEGPLDDIWFDGRIGGFGQDDIFPKGIPIAPDGFGNFWVLDVQGNAPAGVPVFFACHDPPVILHQADSIAGFLSEVVRMYQPPHQSLVTDVHDVRRSTCGARTPVRSRWRRLLRETSSCAHSRPAWTAALRSSIFAEHAPGWGSRGVATCRARRSAAMVTCPSSRTRRLQDGASGRG